jgi:hypothetical protein
LPDWRYACRRVTSQQTEIKNAWHNLWARCQVLCFD